MMQQAIRIHQKGENTYPGRIKLNDTKALIRAVEKVGPSWIMGILWRHVLNYDASVFIIPA